MAQLISDPVGFRDKLTARIKIALTPRSGVRRKKIGAIEFEFDFDLDPAVRKMFAGVYESEVARVLRRCLVSGNVFLDIGANIGYFSAVALNLVGTQGQVHAFEPRPDLFSELKRLGDENSDYRLIANNCALGAKTDRLPLQVTTQRNIGWNTMVPDFMNPSEVAQTIDVEVIRLDDYLTRNDVSLVALIKIDTEGFEYPILLGAESFLSAAPNRPVIICEIAPVAYPKLGLTLAEFSDYMARFDYRAYDLASQQPIDLVELRSTTNILFLPSAKKRSRTG